MAVALPVAGQSADEDGVVAPLPGKSLGARTASAWRNLARDARYVVTFPARPTRKGIIAGSAVLGGTLILVLLDDEIRDEVQRARNETLDRWESRIEPLGSGQVDAIGVLLVYGGGRLAGNENVTETGRALIESLLLTQAFTSVSKGALGRSDPGEEPGAGDFFDGGTIFPSGHTSRAFAIATVLARRHGRAAAWVAYPLAALVGLFRIESDAHWASDVLAGAALGYGISRAVVARREARAAPDRAGAAALSWTPTLDSRRRRFGVALRLRF